MLHPYLGCPGIEEAIIRISIIAGKSFLFIQVMLNVFVTERLCFAKRCSSSCEFLLWAWIAHLLSLQSISFCLCLASIVNAFFPKTVSQLFPVLFFLNLSWHLAVYRPKHGFSFVVMRLRCVDCQNEGPYHWSRSRLRTPFSLVLQCYQKPDGYMLRLTLFSR